LLRPKPGQHKHREGRAHRAGQLAAGMTLPAVTGFYLIGPQAVYPNQARRIAAAQAIQLSHTGIIKVPHGDRDRRPCPLRRYANGDATVG
jgi:hypothetical protein